LRSELVGNLLIGDCVDVAWIWLVGTLGSKMNTFGPKSGCAA
jgi:hypothetical protein